MIISLIVSIVIAKMFMRISNVVEISNNLQRALDELKNLDHGKTEFINIVSHELRSPVTVINGYASMLLEDLVPDQKHLEGPIREIEKSSNHILALTNDMIDISTIELGKLSYVKEQVPLVSVFQELEEKFAEMASVKSISISFPETADIIISKRNFLFKVLRHLIDNAICYTEPGGNVEVSFQRTESEVVFQVRDTGKGIAESEFENIFKTFYQVESTMCRNANGSGLGLAIVKGIVNLMGGRIELESKLGVGTTVRVLLGVGKE